MEIFTESQFSACYIHYRRRVRGYILSRVSDREEAEDLTQDVFENIWRWRAAVFCFGDERGTQGNASQFSLYGYAEHRDRLSAPPLYEKRQDGHIHLL